MEWGEDTKLGISSLLFVGTSIEEAIRRSAELGAECFEMIHDLPHFTPTHSEPEMASIKKLLRAHGLEVSVHARFLDLNPATYYPELWNLSLEQVGLSVRACAELGGDIVCVHSGRCPIPELDWVMRDSKTRTLRFLDECLKLAKRTGVRLAFENLSLPNAPYSTLEGIEELVSNLDIGIALDVGHAYLWERRSGTKDPERRIARTIERLKERLIHFHIHDNHGREDEHLPPGKGDIKFEPLLKALKKINYRGMLIAELWDPKNPLRTGHRGMESLKKLLKRAAEN